MLCHEPSSGHGWATGRAPSGSCHVRGTRCAEMKGCRGPPRLGSQSNRSFFPGEENLSAWPPECSAASQLECDHDCTSEWTCSPDRLYSESAGVPGNAASENTGRNHTRGSRRDGSRAGERCLIRDSEQRGCRRHGSKMGPGRFAFCVVLRDL